jgi:hypothetical protein
VEFINDAWYVLDWMSRGWRTQASKFFSTKDWEHVGLGWYDNSDPEHLDYTYITVRTEEEDPKDKGKARALSQTASVDFHSPQEPETVIKDEELEEKEEMLRYRVICSTLMIFFSYLSFAYFVRYL